MWKIKGYPRKVEESTSEAMEALEADRVKMMDTLAVEKENFEKLLATFEADVAKCKTFSDYEAMEANFGEGEIAPGPLPSLSPLPLSPLSMTNTRRFAPHAQSMGS